MKRLFPLIYFLLPVILITGVLTLTYAAGITKINLFAAASTTNAITEISHIYEKNHKVSMVLSFASSSTLAKQIHQGAPAEIYISANPKWMDFLEKKNRIQPGTRIDLLGNQIVIIAPQNITLKLVIKKGFDLAGILGENRLAMGDPDHVPAGIYGRQALESLGVWRAVAPKVARTQDVRAALVLVERAEAPLGIVYATDAAISKRVKKVAVFPESSHPTITYPAALISGQASKIAADFLNFLKSPDARAVFEKYGFSVR